MSNILTVEVEANGVYIEGGDSWRTSFLALVRSIRKNLDKMIRKRLPERGMSSKGRLTHFVWA